MSSSDKTMNKLLDSMRMSKSGVTEAPASEASAAPDAGQPAASKKAATKKTVTKKKTVAKKKAPVAKAGGRYSSDEGRATVPTESYQSPGRVWPD